MTRDTLDAVIAEMRRANTRWAPSLESIKQGPVRYVRWDEVQAWADRLATLAGEGEQERPTVAADRVKTECRLHHQYASLQMDRSGQQFADDVEALADYVLGEDQ